MLPELLQATQPLLVRHTGNTVVELGAGNALLFRATHPTAIEGSLYDPLLCLILQGAKVVQSGDLSVRCPAGHAILVSHLLPVLSRITEAKPDVPYVAFVMPIDMQLLRTLDESIPESEHGRAPMAALATIPVDAALLGAIVRFLDLLQEGRAVPVLLPILISEIHARLLLSPQGPVLRRLLGRDSVSSQIATAIASIRASIGRPLSVTELARNACMSKSSFFNHFRTVTGLSPRQYQKELRLLEARRLVVEGGLAISSVAFEVGYESPAQFSRDYSRKFRTAPREDRKREQVGGSNTSRQGELSSAASD